MKICTNNRCVFTHRLRTCDLSMIGGIIFQSSYYIAEIRIKVMLSV